MFFRTSGPWGAGTGANLTATQFDENSYQLIQMINAKSDAGVGIASIVVTGNELWVTLTDHTILGPYTLPVALFNFVGQWQPNTLYPALTIFTEGGSTYLVLIGLTTAATFDPGANDGMGHNFYGLLLENAPNALPVGGTVGMALVKSSSADYAVTWETLTLAGLTDVLQSPGPDAGDLIQWNGSAFGYIDPSSIIGAPPAFTELSDVQHSPGPTTDEVPYWTGSRWSFATIATLDPPSTQFLATLGDVASSPVQTTGQVVYWNGSQFSYETLVSSLLDDFNFSSLGNYDALLYDTATSKWINRQPIRYATLGTTPYVLALTDSMSLLDLTSGNQTITINPDVSVNFPIGATIWLRQATAGTGNINTIAAGAGVTIIKPAGRLLKTLGIGAVVRLQKASANNWEASGDLAYDLSPNVLPATGTWSADPTLTDCDVYQWTPAGANTVNIVSGGVQAGKRMFFVITTSGTSSYTLTFGTRFKSQGTLATGVVSGAVFVIEFIGDGTNFNEVSRTAAM